MKNTSSIRYKFDRYIQYEKNNYCECSNFEKYVYKFKKSEYDLSIAYLSNDYKERDWIIELFPISRLLPSVEKCDRYYRYSVG